MFICILKDIYSLILELYLKDIFTTQILILMQVIFWLPNKHIIIVKFPSLFKYYIFCNFFNHIIKSNLANLGCFFSQSLTDHKH